MTLPQVPFGHTARRLEWRFLPAATRQLIEERCGSPVERADSQGGGFTPGFASVLTCADGSRHFVKAASVKAQRVFAESYRAEVRKLAALPSDVPATKLLWWHDDESWVTLGFEYVDGHAPHRPWRTRELERCLDLLELVADVLTPAPVALATDTLPAEVGPFAELWEHVRVTRPALAHLNEAAALAAEATTALAGDTLVHLDVRDDNLIIGGDQVWLCDWNWPVVGPAWVDSISLLVQARGDGLDVDRVLMERRLTRDVSPDHIDGLLALMAGYFFKAADDPVPNSSPHLRDHQAWMRDVTWAWLTERRGWA